MVLPEPGQMCIRDRDKNVRIPEGVLVGYDLDADRARGWHVTDSGVVVIGREHSTVPVAPMFA